MHLNTGDTVMLPYTAPESAVSHVPSIYFSTSQQHCSIWVGNKTPKWTGVVYSCLVPNIPGIDSGFMVTLIRIKQLLKVNE